MIFAFYFPSAEYSQMEEEYKSAQHTSVGKEDGQLEMKTKVEAQKHLS